MADRALSDKAIALLSLASLSTLIVGCYLVPFQCSSYVLYCNFKGLHGLFWPGVHLDTDCDGRL